MRKILLTIIYLIVATQTSVSAQNLDVQIRTQKSFHRTVPHANYSGITYLGNNLYAVVDDKSATDGFYIFNIQIDSLSGDIIHVERKEFRTSTLKNRDAEGIAFHRPSQTILISGEADNQVLAYDTLGRYLNWQLSIPQAYKNLPANLGLEALSCAPDGNTILIANESAPCYITAYNTNSKQKGMYLFEIDKPLYNSMLIGVSEICALSDSTCLVLQREIIMPKHKIGARAETKIYYTTLLRGSERMGTTHKKMIASWVTRFNLTNRSFANYEGMCLGPKLPDNRQVVILLSDSQKGYKGVLKDYFKSIVFQE